MSSPLKEVSYESVVAPGAVSRVYFIKQRGKIIEFTVQLECFIQDQWRPVIRYDTAHGFAHCDVLHPDRTEDKTALPFATYNEALTFALLDLKANWQMYCERYERWLTK